MFTDEQKISLCKILGINPQELQVHLNAYSSDPTAWITPAIEADVISEIARWYAGDGVVNSGFDSKESNEGYWENGGDRVGGSPKSNIESVLFFEVSATSGTEFEMVRG